MIVFWTLRPTTQKTTVGLFSRPAIAHNRSYGKESVALGCLRLDKRPMSISTVFISTAFISGPNIGLLLTDAKVWIGRKANIQIME